MPVTASPYLIGPAPRLDLHLFHVGPTSIPNI